MAYKGQPRAGGGTEIKPGIGRGEAQVFQPVQAPQQDTASIQRAYADKAAREERLAKEEADAEKERKNKLLDVEYEGLPRGSKLPLFDMYNEYRNFMINEEWDEGSDKKQMVIEENIKVTMAALKDGQEEMKGIAKNMDAGKIYENEELFYEMQTQGYYEELFKLPMEEALNKYGEDVILAKQVKPVPKDLGVIALAKQAVGGVGRSKKQTDISAEEQYDNNAALQKAYSLIEWQGVVWNQRNIAKDPKPTKPTKPTTGIGYSAGGYFYNPKIVTIKGKTYEKVESEEGEEGTYTPRPEKDREVVDYPIAAPKETGSVTKSMTILDPNDTEKKKTRIISPKRFRLDNGVWSLMYRYKARDGKWETRTALLSDIATEVEGDLKLTKQILDGWEADRLAKAEGSEGASKASGSKSKYDQYKD